MIGKDLYFEDMAVGEEIPALFKEALTTRQLVKYAGASGDYREIHYDEPAAKAAGLPAVIAHGQLKCACLGQLLTDWIGLNGTIKKLSATYRGLDLPGYVLTCRGKATNKFARDGENLVELEVWTENQTGQITTPGAATVSLPSRSSRVEPFGSPISAGEKRTGEIVAGGLLTEEIRASIGRQGEPVVVEVEKGAIRKFAEAVGDPNPLYYDEDYARTTRFGGVVAPPTYLCVCRTTVKEPATIPARGLHGGNAYELYLPVRPGDVITAVKRIAGFQEKRGGKTGRMLVMTSEITYTNQRGEVVGRNLDSLVKF